MAQLSSLLERNLLKLKTREVYIVVIKENASENVGDGISLIL